VDRAGDASTAPACPSPRFAGKRRDLAAQTSDPRAADWRFLLPEPPAGDVLLTGGAVSCAPFLLADTARHVSVLASPAEAALLMRRVGEEGRANVAPAGPSPSAGTLYDLVALMRPTPGRSRLPGKPLRLLPRMAGHVRPGGHLYLEVDVPAALAPPALVRAFLRGRGFDRVSFYWPKPGFRECEMYMQLGDRRLQRYYLEQMFFCTSVPRRIVRAGLRAASALGVFELTLPAYLVIARRRRAERRVA
jgi:hypothetical protein